MNKQTRNCKCLLTFVLLRLNITGLKFEGLCKYFCESTESGTITYQQIIVYTGELLTSNGK